MESAPLPQDSDTGAANTPETPLPELQKTCLRNSPCMQQGCLTCCTPPNHVRDLSDALDDVTPIATVTKTHGPTIVLANTNDPTNRPTKPKPPPDHVIVSLTEMFLDAIQDNDLYEMNAAMKLHNIALASNLKFLNYDRSDLRTARNQAKQILDTNSATLPPRYLRPPPFPILHQLSHLQPVLNLPN